MTNFFLVIFRYLCDLPIVTFLSEEKVTDFEGCLSVPGKRGKVPRAIRIKYSGYTETGEFIERVAEGWHARYYYKYIYI